MGQRLPFTTKRKKDPIKKPEGKAERIVPASLHPKRDSSGFTLLEMVVALTVMSFMFVIILGVFRLGLSAWEKGESFQEDYQKVRIATQLISQQIRSVVPYKIKPQKAEGDYLAFEGKSRSVKFVSALSLKARQPEGYVFVIYEFSEGREGGRLVFYEQRAVNKEFMDEKPPEESGTTLFEGISDVHFEYYREEDPEKNRQAGWSDEWNAKEEQELPRLFRMTFIAKKESEKKEEPPWIILASLPSNRYEIIRTSPAARFPGSSPMVPGPR